MTKNQTLSQIQDEIVDDFSFFQDWDDKYKFIIDLAKEMPAYPEKFRTDDNKVKGCQSQVWLHAEKDGDKIRFYGDSDALIVKGLVSLLLRVFSGQNAEDILQTPINFIERIGLSTHLSPTRSNGLAAMVKQIKMYALAFQASEKI